MKDMKGRISAKPDRFDLVLLLAQICQESDFNPNAKSRAGAMGLMQLMPATWNEWKGKLPFKNPSPWNPLHNIIAGLLELNRQIESFGDIELALTAYNWGSGNLRRLIDAAGTRNFEQLKAFKWKKTDKDGNEIEIIAMPKEAREYATRIFRHYNDPETLERVDDYLGVA